MRTIALAAAKGGVGRTTLTAALAVAAHICGLRTAIVDLDPQGSLTEWWKLRGDDRPHLAMTGGAPLRAVQASLESDGFDLLLLDCPPGFTPIMRKAIEAADIVVVPTGASALDLEAIASTVEIAERAGVPHCYALNRAVFRSRLAGRAVRELRELGGRLLPVVHQRVAVAEAMAEGRTALETHPGGAAARVLGALWHAARERLADAPSRRRGLAGRELSLQLGVVAG